MKLFCKELPTAIAENCHRNIKETATIYKTSAEVKSNNKNQAHLCFYSLHFAWVVRQITPDCGSVLSVAAEGEWQGLVVLLAVAPDHPIARGLAVTTLLCHACQQAMCFQSYCLFFFPCENEHCCAKQNRMNNDLECLLKHKCPCRDWSGRVGQQQIVQSSDFHHLFSNWPGGLC